jgi:NADPH-dependent 2,4-dienoyl-CoA reductase/sulfur reductase-like enzyme/nitrite reductase/ring-hydroxylating ferredoxin subunit
MATEFQLKGITSLDLPPGQKREVEVEGVDGAKVLLVNANNKIHALSPKCTHYGAPLVRGVLHGNRLTCLWHGACFNVTTGDVEDAPALDPLAKFHVEERDGKVYIKGDPAVVKANFPNTLSLKCTAPAQQQQGEDGIVVVGGGSGCLGAVEGLRSGGYKGKLTVISSEGYQPIDRTKLSKALVADVSKLAWRSKAFYADSSIQLVDDEVTSVDFAARSVATKSGKSFPYTSLVLSTGGSPRRLPQPGFKGDLANVFVLRTAPHVKSILDAIGSSGSKKVVVIGSSFIGMEVANCLAGKGHSVSVVGMEDVPMSRVMGDEVGAIFQRLLEKNGVRFHLAASVDSASPRPDDPSSVGAVRLKDGTVLDADLVIQGVGVAPATDFLRGNPAVSLLPDGSLATDDAFAVKGLDAVYAIGDIATFPYRGPGGDGHPVRIEHWNVAQNAGRVVAAAITAPGRPPMPFIPVFWSALGQQLRYCGNTVAGYDDVVLLGQTGPDKICWVAYYTKGETVVAVATMGKDPLMSQCAELMRLGKMPGKSELKAGLDVLTL